MRKLVFGAAAMLYLAFMPHSYAQAQDWTLQAIVDPRADLKPVVGFIYHTDAVGTQIGKNDKFVTGLRMICSTRPSLAPEPLIALYWNNLVGVGHYNPEVRVDNKIVDQSAWEQNGPLLMKTLNDSKQLLQAMKTGRTISFDWTGGDNTRRRTIFSLHDFNANLGDFNKSCNL